MKIIRLNHTVDEDTSVSGCPSAVALSADKFSEGNDVDETSVLRFVFTNSAVIGSYKISKGISTINLDFIFFWLSKTDLQYLPPSKLFHLVHYQPFHNLCQFVLLTWLLSL